MRGGERLRHRPQHEVEVTVDLFGSRQDETLGRFGLVDPGQETQGAADLLVAFLGGGDRPVRPATPLLCRDPLDVVAEMLEAERPPEPIPTGRLIRFPADVFGDGSCGVTQPVTWSLGLREADAWRRWRDT